jgi:hypothetical protein
VTSIAFFCDTLGDDSAGNFNSPANAAPVTSSAFDSELAGDYSGDNFAATSRLCQPGEQPKQRGVRRVWQCVPWGAWIRREGSPSDLLDQKPLHVSSHNEHLLQREGNSFSDDLLQRSPISSALLYLSHPWHRLTATTKPFSARFSIPSLPGATGAKVSPASVSIGAPRGAANADGAHARISLSSPPDAAGADNSIGSWAQLRISWSVSGVASPLDVLLSLEGKPIHWQPEPHLDRQFHQYTFDRRDSSRALLQGPHELLVRAGRPEASATLCHLMVHVFAPGFGTDLSGATGQSAEQVLARGEGSPERLSARGRDLPADTAAGGTSDQRVGLVPPPAIGHAIGHNPTGTVDTTGGLVGTFPVSSRAGCVIGYRPTQDSCLMREMRNARLCPVCTEALWRNLLTSPAARRARVSIIHWVRIAHAPEPTRGMGVGAFPPTTHPGGELRIAHAPEPTTGMRESTAGMGRDASSPAAYVGGAESRPSGYRKGGPLLFVEARVAPLGHLRQGKPVPGEAMSVTLEPLEANAGNPAAAIEVLPTSKGADEGLGPVVSCHIPLPLATERLHGERGDRTSLGAADSQGVVERCWRIVARVASPEVRSFELSSEVCFCVRESSRVTSPAGRGVGARCMPCPNQSAPVRFDCPIAAEDQHGRVNFLEDCTVPFYTTVTDSGSI